MNNHNLAVLVCPCGIYVVIITLQLADDIFTTSSLLSGASVAMLFTIYEKFKIICKCKLQVKTVHEFNT